MAKVVFNASLLELSGAIQRFVFSKRSSGTVVYPRPGPQKRDRKGKLITTPRRAAGLKSFAGAVERAQYVYNKPESRAFYNDIAQLLNRSAWHLALSDARVAPVVHGIDWTGFNGRKGDTVLIHATDNFAVTDMRVRVRDLPKGKVCQDAVAAPDTATEHWRFELTQDLGPGQIEFEVSATDYPGNTTVYRATWDSSGAGSES